MFYFLSRSLAIFVLQLLNPFPNTPFCDCPKFKEAADDNLNAAFQGFQDTGSIENIVEKGKLLI